MKKIEMTLKELEDMITNPLKESEKSQSIIIRTEDIKVIEAIDNIIKNYGLEVTRDPVIVKVLRIEKSYKGIQNYGFSPTGTSTYTDSGSPWNPTHLIEIIQRREEEIVIHEDIIEMMLM